MQLRGFVFALAFVVIGLGGAAPAAAQVFNGRIVGTIVDDKGTAVVGATVEARNAEATPPVRRSITDDEGRFGVMGLRTGTWVVMVEARGHEPTMLAIDVQAQRPGGTVTIPVVRIETQYAPTFSTVSAAAVMRELDTADGLVLQGKPDAALVIYDAILLKAPALTSVQLSIARAARAAKDFARSHAALAALLTSEPGSLAARYELGLTYAAAGDVAAARRELQRVVAEGGESRTAALARAQLAVLPK